jgi:hypothetical protein
MTTITIAGVVGSSWSMRREANLVAASGQRPCRDA